jgi:hypothetical protein
MKTITILVVAGAIMASGPFSESEDEFEFSGLIYPKAVIPGYEIHEVALQDEEKISDFTWNGTELVKIIHTPVLPTEADYVVMIDEVLQAGAEIRTYDNIINASLRAGYPGPFHEEGLQYATWMDTVWAIGYDCLAQVSSGQIPQPTLEEFKAMLPPCPVTPR